MSFLPSLRQLGYLVSLDEHRHFGRAAEAMGASQSTLSAGLRELERLLGVTLVERSRRGVHFTPLGREVVDKARSLLADAEQLTDIVRARAEPMTGELRLAVIPTIAPFLLPKLLATLHQRWPRLQPVLREETSAAACEALRLGQIDCVLLALPFACGETETLELFDDPLLIALPASSPLAQAKVINASALDPARLLLLEDGHCLKDHALAACDATALRGRSAMLGTSLFTLVQMTAGGLGATFVPQMAVKAGIADDPAIAVRPVNAAPGRSASRKIALLWRRNSPRAPDFQLLGDAIRTAAAA